MRLFSGSDDKTQERVRATSLINALVAAVPCCSVTSVRKRLQAFGIERGGSSVQAHERRALASEACDMCEICGLPLYILISWPSLHSHFVALPQVKNQHLTAPNNQRRLEWCTSMLQRLGEARRPHSSTILARHTLISVSGPFSELFQAPLQTIFTPFFVVLSGSRSRQWRPYSFWAECTGTLRASR